MVSAFTTDLFNSAFSGFSVVIFGQQLTADKAKKLIYGLAGQKDEFYALYAVMQTLPCLTMIAEPVTCDSWMMKLGGHIWRGSARNVSPRRASRRS